MAPPKQENGTMKISDSYIHLQNLRFYAFHGVLDQERRVGAYFFVSIRVKVNLTAAVQTDQLTDTLSYADVYQAVQAEMQVPSLLLEHVAGRICEHIYSHYPTAEAIDITLEKENAPIGTGAQGVAGITLHTTR